MKEHQLLTALRDNPFLLAPMAGVTDLPFRTLMKRMGAGILTTELVSAKALELHGPKHQKIMHFEDCQRPVGVQIFGDSLSAFDKAARMVEEEGADFLDLNFGCPVPKIVKKGGGSAILKDLKQLEQVLYTVKKAITIPLTIKIRMGWDSSSKNANEVCKIAYNEGVTWVSLHGRTRSQGFSGKADWSYISYIKQNAPLPLIGNGDLVDKKQIIQLKKVSQCDGMMIGRACLKNPWIFIELKNEDFHATAQNILNVLNELEELLNNFYEERRLLLQYKKFCSWFASGKTNSAQFRQQIFQTRSLNEAKDLAEGFFSGIQRENKLPLAWDASLMQGHG